MILLYLLVCLLVAGFFAGMETGLLAGNRMLIQSKAENRVVYARAAEFLLSKPERLLGTTLIGHNIANVTAAVLVTNYFESLGLSTYTWIAIVAMAFVFLVFDDYIPKSFLRQHANNVAARLAPVVFFFYWIFLPIYLVLNTIVRILLVFTGLQNDRRDELTTRSDLRFLVNVTGKEAGLPGEDQRIIEDILRFRDQIAREAMLPFHKLPVLSVTQSMDDMVALFVKTGERFLPVSKDRTDNVIGYVDANDLVSEDFESISDILRPTRYFPESRRIPDLLLDMNRDSLELVFLVDEYGGVSGMITPDQIVADVVGFTPEGESFELEIQALGAGRYSVDAEADLEDLGREIGVTLSQSVSTTVGGFVSERLGKIPQIGEAYEESGYRFVVTERNERHVGRVEVSSRALPFPEDENE